jgi:hypothetical protein
VILAGAGPDLDHRCRSTWSRALRFAARNNVVPTKLVSFLRRNGGLSRSALKLSKRNRPVPTKLDDQNVVRR